MAFLTFYVPFPDEISARRVASEMVTARLAACANIYPIQSVYWWEGALQQEGEWVAILKTRNALESALESAIIAAHPYQTPCVMRFEVRANSDYENWINESTA